MARRHLRHCIMFITALVIYSPLCLSDFSFSGKILDSFADADPRTPKSELEEELHRCVEDICAPLDPNETLKSQIAKTRKNAKTSKFYDADLAPLLKRLQSQSQRIMNDTVRDLKKIHAENPQIQLTNEDREVLAFLEVLKLRNAEEPPATFMIEDFGDGEGVRIKYGALSQFSEDDFARQVQRKEIFPEHKAIWKSFIGRGNYARFFTKSEENFRDVFSNWIRLHGRGARRAFLEAYKNTTDFYKVDPLFKNYSSVFPMDSLEENRRLLEYNFDELKALQNVVNYDFRVFRDLEKFDFGREIWTTSSEDIRQYAKSFPSIIPSRQILKIIQRLEAKALEESRVSIDEIISPQCRAKFNSLHEGLPTHEQLQESRHIVNQSIAHFQRWMFENMSIETASSIFEFLKGWDVFLPPSKAAFGSFAYNAISVTNLKFQTRHSEDSFRVLLAALTDSENALWKSTFNGFTEVSKLCDSINTSPMQNSTRSELGQVRIGWMTLKNPQLLRNVIWHELAHIVSDHLKGKNLPG